MKVPYNFYAYVPEDKLAGYLISLTHPQGSVKAKVFRSRGFDETNTDLLRKELLSVIHDNDYEKRLSNQWGIKYTVIGLIKGPNGKTINLETGWIVDKGKRSPRFVTAYPV